MEQFDIPIVMIIFKRIDTTLRILEKISHVMPRKLYLLGDQGRNEEEKALVSLCRKEIEEHINWDCEIIKNYAEENRGVYANIALGAKWVFEREETAIFLEDDNLPEETFFDYCKELLFKYRDDSRVLWICGTNYLGNYINKNGESYMFTKHLLPCGWASWSNKFLKYYDFDMLLADDADLRKRVKFEYESSALYHYQMYKLGRELFRKHTGQKFASWDFQMMFSLRVHNLYGISPSCNQIENVGADEFSEHGGTSLEITMTRRFCGMKSYPLTFPLIHPKTNLIDKKYEKLTEKIILPPFFHRNQIRFAIFIKRIFIKRIFGIDEYTPFRKALKQKFQGK